MSTWCGCRQEQRLLLWRSIADSEARDEIYRISVDAPGNSVPYCAGYLEIKQMREEAEAALGDYFDLKEFHTFLLGMGPEPFAVI